MRQIQYGGKVVDYTSIANLSQNYDAKNFSKDTEYIILNVSVLGNALGRENVDGDDMGSALAAAHGRKYNNARVALPLTREFISKNYTMVDKAIQRLAGKASSICAGLQKEMNVEQKKLGRETAIRSRAIREARTTIQNSQSVFDGDLFNDVNTSVRAGVASKLIFTCGVSISSRRIEDTEGLENKGQFKRKTFIGADGQSYEGFATTVDERGLKRVPVYNNTRDNAEQIVYNIALVVKDAVDKIPANVNDEDVFKALENIIEMMPGNDSDIVQIEDFNTEELERIESMKNEILNKYNSLD